MPLARVPETTDPLSPASPAPPTNGDRHWDTLLGFVILFGRFFMIIPVMALAGSLVKKKAAPIGAGSFPVTGATFITLLIGTVVIVGALTFFPVLALSPIVEHFLMHGIASRCFDRSGSNESEP